ncbi:MAG: redoxin domain-containing protein [Anaerolineae bacterium]|nr:redoxin domain-containing protein [Anaerolineae bacterium]
MQSDPEFQALNVAFVSIAFDPSDQQMSAITEYGISDVPMLIDAEHTVSEAYDVLKWAVGSGEPSHTFVLVDADGNIAWIRDYGSPSLPDPVMYVPPADLIQQIKDSL